MMAHTRADCIHMSFSIVPRWRHCVRKPIMMFMDIIHHEWNLFLPTLGVGAQFTTFGSELP